MSNFISILVTVSLNVHDNKHILLKNAKQDHVLAP